MWVIKRGRGVPMHMPKLLLSLEAARRRTTQVTLARQGLIGWEILK